MCVQAVWWKQKARRLNLIAECYIIFIKLQEVVSWFARTAVLFSMASFALTAGRPLSLCRIQGLCSSPRKKKIGGKDVYEIPHW